MGGHGLHLRLGETKTILHGIIQHGGYCRIVEVAEDALLGYFEYPDDHRLLQIGVVLEGLHHEAADEGDHLIVEAAGVGGVQRGVVLVQQDVNRLAVCAFQPGGEMFYRLRAVLICAFFIRYFEKQLFIGFAQHFTVLQVFMSLIFRGEHFPDDFHALRMRCPLGILET